MSYRKDARVRARVRALAGLSEQEDRNVRRDWWRGGGTGAVRDKGGMSTEEP